jgi:hypothetical protein
MLSTPTTSCLDRAGEFSKSRREPMSWISVQAEFVVSAAQVLDECMASANYPGRAKPFEATHRSEPGLEPTVIGFDGVVGVLLHDVADRRQQLIEYPWVGGRPISGHLGWAWAVFKSAGEESASGRQIPILRDEDIDDLAILVDRAVQIDPTPGDFDVSFIDEPAIARRVPAGPGRIDQQRSKSLHPPVDSDGSTVTPRSASSSSTSRYESP